MHLSLPHPWLLLVALALAAAGILWLLRPPRRRLAVAYLTLWRNALAAVGPQRAWRRPRTWTLLLACGGLLVAGAAGGANWLARRPAPPAVLVVIADTPQLAAKDAGGVLQRDALARRLDQLLAALDPATPVRLAVVGGASRPREELAAAADLRERRATVIGRLAGPGMPPDLADVERTLRQPADAAVYLLGEFAGVATAGEGLQWVFRPAPPGNDVGIVAAGAETVGERTQIFVAAQRLAGPGCKVQIVIEDAAKPAAALATAAIDLAGVDRAGAVATLPDAFTGALRIRLVEPDDQPLNDVFYLAPAGSEGVTTVQLSGRPDPWIRKAVAASERLAELPAGQGPAAWLVLNEPVDRVAAAPGQGLVLVDPLSLPSGLVPAGELRDVKLASHLAAPPWQSIPFDGVTVRRARAVRIADPRWAAVASDAAGHPLVVLRTATRELVVLFSVAADNSDWFADRAGSWPMFWNALALLEGGPAAREAGARTWAWRRGTRAGTVTAGGAAGVVAVNLPPDAFAVTGGVSPPDINTRGIRVPPPAARATAQAAWIVLAALGAALLLAGWMWSAARANRKPLSLEGRGWPFRAG